MTLLWMDGFDHYGTESNTTAYGVYGAATGSFSTSIKRTGTTSYELQTGGQKLTRVFPTTQTSVGVGLAFYLSALPSETISCQLFKMVGTSGYGQCIVSVDNAGYIVLFRGENVANSPSTGAEVARSASAVVTTQAWQHCEIAYVPNGASSTIEVRLNGVAIISETFAIGSSTYGEQAATTVTAWWAVMGGSTGILYIDDLFAWNGSGSFNNDFLGDKKVATLMPNADTATADWSKNSGSVGYDRINEIGPNGDTSYIYANTSSLTSKFDFEAMPTDAGVINAVQTYTATKKTDAGTCTVRTDIVSGSSNTTGTAQPATTAYQYYQDVFETDPATGVLWTKAGVDGAKVQVVRTA